MKLRFTFFAFILNIFMMPVFSQNVGINTTGAAPAASAGLDIDFNNKGLLIPRVSLTSTTDAVTINSPAVSMLVYNTNNGITGTGAGGTGFYYWNGTLWIKFANDAWLLNGNAGINDPAAPATYGTSIIGANENYVGTQDAQDLVFATNMLERMRIKQSTGFVGIGLSNPFSKLNISGGNWDVENGIGDFQVGDGTYRFKLGLATGGAGSGDVRMTSHGGTNRIFIGGGTNSEVVTIDGTNQRVGIKNTIAPNSVLDVAGDLALREGPAIAISAGNTYPILTLTVGAEFSHYRLTSSTVPFWPYLILNGNDGQIITFINTSGQPMGVYNWDAANGIMTGTGANLNPSSTTTYYQSFTVIYNATLQRWIVVGYTGMTDNNDWHTTGNTGTNDPSSPITYGTSTIGSSENYVGTHDAQDLVFATNMLERMRIKQSTGFVGIGLSNPFTKLNVSGGNWDVENGIGDFQVGDGTYRFKLGLVNGGAGAGDVRMTSHGGTNRIFIGGGTNSEVITVDGANQRVGIKNNIAPNSVFDVAGDLALREGPAIALPAATTYPLITLTAGNEFSHYRLTGGTVPFWLYEIQGGNDGQIVTFINNSASQPMNIYNWNVVNGILTGTGNHLTSTAIANSTVTLIYNASLQRWLVIGYTGMTDNNDPDWHITGNAVTNDPAAPVTYGTSTIAANENWAGTTDANDYVIGTNTIERFRVKQTSGNVGIGISAPTAKLHILTPESGQIGLYAENSYAGNSTAYGVYGVSNNNPGYGYGGFFSGGLYGVYTNATNSGAGSRYGGRFNGWYGDNLNYGSYNYGYGGTTAYGIYALSSGGSTQSIGAYVDGVEYGIIVPNTGGNSGFGTTAPQQRLSVDEGANIDQDNVNNGTTTNALTFGSGSGEGIGSKRTATDNQYGLDFYQGFANRMRIWNDGNVVIGQNSAASLAPFNSGLGNPNLTILNPSTLSQTSDIPLFTARHSGSSGTTWQMGSIEYYTEGEANIGFTYQLCPLNGHTSTNLGGTTGSKYFGYRWNQLFCSVAPNVSSDINLKKEVKAIDYGIHQLRKINPIAYKFKVDYAGTDNEIPDAEKRTHIGFNAQEVKQIIPEIVSSWDYMTNNEDGYIKAKTPTLGMVYEEMIPVAVNAIKQLDKQQQAIINTISISDFGMEQTKTNEVRVLFAKEFKNKLEGKPIVTITALEPNASYYIASIDNDGFVIKNNNSNTAMSFNWIAMAKINEQQFDIPTNYTDEMHQQKLKEIEAFEASLPSNEEVINMVKAKTDAKYKNTKPASVLTAEQEKVKQETEKVRSNSKTLEQKLEKIHEQIQKDDLKDQPNAPKLEDK